jgi:hypothetical protein
MTKHVELSDSLVIDAGTLDLATFTVNGTSSGRTMVMRGGELITNGGSH